MIALAWYGEGSAKRVLSYLRMSDELSMLKSWLLFSLTLFPPHDERRSMDRPQTKAVKESSGFSVCRFKSINRVFLTQYNASKQKKKTFQRLFCWNTADLSMFWCLAAAFSLQNYKNSNNYKVFIWLKPMLWYLKFCSDFAQYLINLSSYYSPLFFLLSQ